jgi:probable F420-dependent oxidoreductase
MDWGIHLPHLGRNVSPEALVDFARRCEAAGCHSAWVSDHVAWPVAIESAYPYSDDGSFPAPPDVQWLDPLGTLFFVAASTERIRLGTSVLILGYRPPVLTAKAVASLDVLSRGRVILGVGVGWMKEEFDVLGMPFDHRGRRADEQLEVFRTLFGDERPSYTGTYYGFPEVGFAPKPAQAGVPIWVGGDTEPAFRRAARYGDAFHAAFQPRAEVAAGWRRVQALAEGNGRSVDELRLSVRLYLDPDHAMPAAKSIAGSPEQMLDTAGAWAAIGADHILLDPVARGGVEGRLRAVEGFMADVAERAGAAR